MPLPTSGIISLADIQTEFGGTNPISISEYYGVAANVPASGMISLAHFYGTSASSPIIESNATYQLNTTSSSHAVTLPTGITAGDLILMIFRPADTRTVTLPSGWTAVADRSSSGQSRIMAKVATGSEGATQTVAISGASRAVAITWRISGWGGNIASDVVAAFGTAGTDTCPSLNPGWGTVAKQWFCGVTGRRSDWNTYETPFVEEPDAVYYTVKTTTTSSSTAYVKMAAESLGSTFASFSAYDFETATASVQHPWTMAVR